MFREDKATQLAAYLIKKAGGCCEYLTLLKMMYDADREMVLKWGTPIIFDNWVAMHNGPVLSGTYDQIKPDKPTSPYWDKHIKTEDYDVKLVSDPGDDLLSDAELEMADKGFRDFDGLGWKEAVTKSHELFQEWVDPGDTSVPITVQEVLSVNGQDEPEYLREVADHRSLNELFTPLLKKR